jgi:hypothetical protein
MEEGHSKHHSAQEQCTEQPNIVTENCKLQIRHSKYSFSWQNKQKYEYLDTKDCSCWWFLTVYETSTKPKMVIFCIAKRAM